MSKLLGSSSLVLDLPVEIGFMDAVASFYLRLCKSVQEPVGMY
jgi:hypothetical protein